MLKNILFDFGGVICDFNFDALVRHFFPDPADHTLVVPILYRNWAALDAGSVDYAVYAAETTALLPERLRQQGQEFFEDWYRHMRPIPEMWGLIAELKARGFRTYILSNSSTRFAENAHVFSIVRLMDGCLFSAPLRMIKPDRAIYEHALRAFDLDPAQSLFIDDNPVNARAAEAAGIRGYAFDGDVEKLRRCIDSLA